jgi:hypothetical protein
MSNPQGIVSMQVDGASYRLHLGMSVMAEVQEKYGKHFDDLMDGTLEGMPNLWMLHAMFSGALRRFHPDKAENIEFVDDLIAQNKDALATLITGASPEPSAEGKAPVKRPSRRG